ncbi:pollen-specific leucine-rich repeat extensin-like protein 1 [Mizuhopecten yessoensis]|uniref:pollen-specific leucine-rich repeat extensin-like protein 1 n=1 Tax=Mizuhopecten yessoensis TaxID=6573 RepID=UPI000B45CF25|nr:pollen-specific leucine-rich repeat extensin-like protein 1 [Mizuhopecten yessoensis]
MVSPGQQVVEQAKSELKRHGVSSNRLFAAKRRRVHTSTTKKQLKRRKSTIKKKQVRSSFKKSTKKRHSKKKKSKKTKKTSKSPSHIQSPSPTDAELSVVDSPLPEIPTNNQTGSSPLSSPNVQPSPESSPDVEPPPPDVGLPLESSPDIESPPSDVESPLPDVRLPPESQPDVEPPLDKEPPPDVEPSEMPKMDGHYQNITKQFSDESSLNGSANIRSIYPNDNDRMDLLTFISNTREK